jgi:hypothetical protein
MSERGSTDSGPPGLDRLTSVALIRSGRVDVSGLRGSSTAVLRLRRVWLGGQVAAAGGPQRGSGVRRALGEHSCQVGDAEVVADGFDLGAADQQADRDRRWPRTPSAGLPGRADQNWRRQTQPWLTRGTCQGNDGAGHMNCVTSIATAAASGAGRSGVNVPQLVPYRSANHRLPPQIGVSC